MRWFWLLGLLLVAQVDAAPVAADVHVINFGNYDVNKGTYVLDMYLHFSYNVTESPNLDVTKFEFMNGRAASKDLLSDSTENGIRDLWYRIQANLYSEPRFANYPFDTQVLGFELEDALSDARALTYVGQGGLEPGLRVPGWEVGNAVVRVENHTYSFGETYSRLIFQFEVSRPVGSTALRSFLPPVAFVIVAGVSFMLHKSKSANRITLGTGMLISAVAFHISQTSSLPTLGALTFFDRFMMAVYTFIVASLAVSTYMAYEDDHRKDVDRSALLNRRGLMWAIVLPVAVFIGLSLL